MAASAFRTEEKKEEMMDLSKIKISIVKSNHAAMAGVKACEVAFGEKGNRLSRKGELNEILFG
ncbi:MAG: hypothetical protein V1492_02880 [Candidatus Micrarchaeota archaeon]